MAIEKLLSKKFSEKTLVDNHLRLSLGNKGFIWDHQYVSLCEVKGTSLRFTITSIWSVLIWTSDFWEDPKNDRKKLKLSVYTATSSSHHLVHLFFIRLNINVRQCQSRKDSGP